MTHSADHLQDVVAGEPHSAQVHETASHAAVQPRVARGGGLASALELP